ncbi:hypothetical protein [Mangrovibacter yixingensis]|uniref:hypothetical protein n=1 Tax=Mangrovibacter yixingensis TaxID=1529639 RepID=UPI001CFA1665|nr:hypothetical protein [Mangrovibacter yixingensis]
MELTIICYSSTIVCYYGRKLHQFLFFQWRIVSDSKKALFPADIYLNEVLLRYGSEFVRHNEVHKSHNGVHKTSAVRKRKKRST